MYAYAAAAAVAVEDESIFIHDTLIRKIIAFISAYAYAHKEKEKLIPKLQKEIFELCKKCNTDRLVNTYKEYSKLFNLVELYDKLLKPVLCKIGNLWKQGKLNVATEEIFIILL